MTERLICDLIHLDNLLSMFEDDYCFYQGESSKILLGVPYVLVVGPIGVGKGTYCRTMSAHDSEKQYVSIQMLSTVYKIVRENADKIIYITEDK